MTIGETAKLLAVLAASYPKFEVDDLKVQVWHEMLGDLDYSVASLAVKKLIMQNTFPPAIAEVRKVAAELMNRGQVTGAEAWGEVIKAIRSFGYYREEEALASMSPTTAKVVRHMGWREICLSDEPSVIRGQFLKMYEQVSNREMEEQQLPPEIRNDIKQLSEKMKMLEGGKEDEPDWKSIQ